MVRAAREALLYSEFRDVFGRKICEWPMAARQVRDLVETAQRSTAGVFKVYDLFLRLGCRLQPGLKSKEPPEIQKLRFDLRELIILQKLHTAYEAVSEIRKAMSIFGGHGVIEDFSSLPRLFRDATVNELWEGPRNVLLMQVFRDLQRVSQWYPPGEFVRSVLQGMPEDLVNDLSAQLADFLEKPPLFELDSDSMERAVKWEEYCGTLFRAYQDSALKDVGKAPIVSPEKMAIPSVWLVP